MSKHSRLRMADVVRMAMTSAVTRFDANEPLLRTARDPEALHQARVATRRLRSDLGTLREFVDAKWATNLRAELRWLGAELGAVRDIEVLQARLTLHTALLPDSDADTARAAVRRLETDHAEARTELLLALSTPRYAELQRELHEGAVDPRVTAAAAARADKELPGVVRPTWRRLRKAVDGLGNVPSDAALHEARIRAKHCRYAAELAAPVIGKPARELAAAVERVQEVLGEHQDAVVAGAWLAKTAPECGPSGAYAVGMLAEVERNFGAGARTELAAVWDAARARRLRAWL